MMCLVGNNVQNSSNNNTNNNPLTDWDYIVKRRTGNDRKMWHTPSFFFFSGIIFLLPVSLGNNHIIYARIAASIAGIIVSYGVLHSIQRLRHSEEIDSQYIQQYLRNPLSSIDYPLFGIELANKRKEFIIEQLTILGYPTWLFGFYTYSSIRLWIWTYIGLLCLNVFILLVLVGGMVCEFVFN